MKAFISHSFKDKQRFDDLCHAFEQANVPHWSPSAMLSGLSLRDQLRQSIEQCDVCIFLATTESIQASWCQAELGAFWGSGKRVIVYLADKSLSPQNLPEQLKGDLWNETLRDVVLNTRVALDDAEKARRESTQGQPIQLRGRDQPTILDRHPPQHFSKLFISGPTLMHTSYRRPYFQEILEAGGQVRLLLPNPSLDSPAVQGLRNHWHHGSEHFSDFLDELRKSLRSLAILQEWFDHQMTGLLAIAYLDCAPTLSLVMANDDVAGEEIQVEVLPFNTDATSRPHFVLRPDSHKKWHTFFKQRCNDMWKRAIPLSFASFDIDRLEHTGTSSEQA